MGFRQGAYATVWKVTDKGKYSEVQLSTSRKKDKDSNEYKTDFSSNFVRFIGDAHKKASVLKEKDRIKIGSCEVTNSYNKDTKQSFTNFLVFSLEDTDDNNNNNKPSNKDHGAMNQVGNIEADELPFS